MSDLAQSQVMHNANVRLPPAPRLLCPAAACRKPTSDPDIFGRDALHNPQTQKQSHVTMPKIAFEMFGAPESPVARVPVLWDVYDDAHLFAR